MNLRSGRTTDIKQSDMSDKGESSGEEIQAGQVQNRGDVNVNPTPMPDKDFFLQLFQNINQNVEQNNKNVEKKFESIKQTCQEMLTKIDKLEENNVNLNIRMETINVELNKKIDNIAINIENEIIKKVDSKIDSRVQEVQQNINKVIDNKIENIDKQISNVQRQNKNQYDELNNKIIQETGQIKEQIGIIQINNNSQGIINRANQWETEKVYFYGDYKVHPKTFVKNLYELLRNVNDIRNIKTVIRNNLKGDAEIWYAIVEDKYDTLEQFIEIFLANFWGEAQQSKVREKLFNGRYRENMNDSKERYVLKKYSDVRYLEPKMPDTEIIKYLARHFNDEIRDVILIQGIDTIDRLLQYLRRIEDVKMSNYQKELDWKRKNRYEKDLQWKEQDVNRQRNYGVNEQINMQPRNDMRNYRRYDNQMNYGYRNKNYNNDNDNRNYNNYNYKRRNYYENDSQRRNQDEQKQEGKTQSKEYTRATNQQNNQDKPKTDRRMVNQITRAIVEDRPQNTNFQ